MQLRSTTSHAVIGAFKAVFGRHEVPDTLVSDNGPQYSSAEFTEIPSAYGFKHPTRSLHYPYSSGLAERMEKTVKKIFKGSSDQPLALLSYRITPLPWCGLSPAKLCMGQKLRIGIPQTKDSLTPEWPYLVKSREEDMVHNRRQKERL